MRSELTCDLLSVEQPAEDVCIFWFAGPKPYVTSVAAILRQDCCLVIDSFCGSDYMDWVREELQRRFVPGRFCLLNTHFHWDHIWGNSSFADCPIYSTSLCKQFSQIHWRRQIEENGQYFRGKPGHAFPTCLIDEAVEILPQLFAFPSPGHTADSLSVWDAKNCFLFAGDCVELPVVQLCQPDLAAYRQTIQRFMELQPKAVFSGHCRCCEPSVLTETAAYLSALAEKKNLHFEDETAQQTHKENQYLMAHSPSIEP